MIDRTGEHVYFQHHPCPAARGRVINRAVLVARKVADLNGIERPCPLGQCTARKAVPQWPGEHVGIERKDGGGEGH